MGVREIAAAAVDAKAAAEALAEKQNQKLHGDSGVRLVQERLGLTGKFVRARTNEARDDDWGDGTVVRIEDDGGPLFIAVSIVQQWSGGQYNRHRTGIRVDFALANANGHKSLNHPTAEQMVTKKDGTHVWFPLALTPPTFQDLPGLAKALEAYDKFVAATDSDELSKAQGSRVYGTLRFVTAES